MHEPGADKLRGILSLDLASSYVYVRLMKDNDESELQYWIFMQNNECIKLEKKEKGRKKPSWDVRLLILDVYFLHLYYLSSLSWIYQ